MPTYEYECQKCKHRFDVFQSMTAELIKECEECKGNVRRLIGAGAGIIFKGSGFYVNDYKKKTPSSKSSSSDSSSTKSSETSSSESTTSKSSETSSTKTE